MKEKIDVDEKRRKIEKKELYSQLKEEKEKEDDNKNKTESEKEERDVNI